MGVRATALLLGLLLAAVPARAADPPPLNWAAVRDMPADALARQLFGEVGEIMFLRHHQVPAATGRLSLPLRWLTFLTRPRASYRAGVCETDWVTVEFEPAPFALGPDPAVRPRRFTVSTKFIVQDLAKVRDGGPSVDEMPALEKACVAIDPREVSPIIAGSAFDVTGTVGLLADLVDSARAGRAAAPLECRDHLGEALSEAACLQNLARLKPEQTYQAQLLADCVPGDATRYCRQASVWDFSQGVDIRFEMIRGSGKLTRITVTPVPDTSDITN